MSILRDPLFAIYIIIDQFPSQSPAVGDPLSATETMQKD